MRQAYDGVRPYLGFLLTRRARQPSTCCAPPARSSARRCHWRTRPRWATARGGAQPRGASAGVRGSHPGARVPRGLPGRHGSWRSCVMWKDCPQERSAVRLQLTRSEVRVRERHLRLQFLEHLRAWGCWNRYSRARAPGWLAPHHGALRCWRTGGIEAVLRVRLERRGRGGPLTGPPEKCARSVERPRSPLRNTLARPPPRFSERRVPSRVLGPPSSTG